MFSSNQEIQRFFKLHHLLESYDNIGWFCLVVELHRRRSSTNGYTPLSSNKLNVMVLETVRKLHQRQKEGEVANTDKRWQRAVEGSSKCWQSMSGMWGGYIFLIFHLTIYLKSHKFYKKVSSLPTYLTLWIIPLIQQNLCVRLSRWFAQFCLKVRLNMFYYVPKTVFKIIG